MDLSNVRIIDSCIGHVLIGIHNASECNGDESETRQAPAGTSSDVAGALLSFWGGSLD